MIPQHRLQLLLHRKDAREAAAECSAWGYSEGWAICDGALVIYDVDDPPKWFQFERDENGNSLGQEPCECLTPGECNAQPGCLQAVSEESPTQVGDKVPEIKWRSKGSHPLTPEREEGAFEIVPCGCSLHMCQEKADCGRGRGGNQRVSSGRLNIEVEDKAPKNAVNIDLTINGKKPEEYVQGLDTVISLLGKLTKR